MGPLVWNARGLDLFHQGFRPALVSAHAGFRMDHAHRRSSFYRRCNDCNWRRRVAMVMGDCFARVCGRYLCCRAAKILRSSLAWNRVADSSLGTGGFEFGWVRDAVGSLAAHGERPNQSDGDFRGVVCASPSVSRRPIPFCGLHEPVNDPRPYRRTGGADRGGQGYSRALVAMGAAGTAGAYPCSGFRLARGNLGNRCCRLLSVDPKEAHAGGLGGAGVPRGCL